MSIRVLVVDDDPLLRAGLRLMLGGADDLDVVGEAGDGDTGVALVGEVHPDVVLMDIRMPGTDGIVATARVAAHPDPPSILVLTTFDADDLIRQAICAGADGYLLKDTPPADLVNSIRAAAAGHGVLSPAVTKPLLELVQRTLAREPLTPMSGLTERERDVARAVCGGASNAEIAAQLYLSTATVKATVSRILTKLGLANRTQIAVLIRSHACDDER